ncbi:kinase-like domain-containing protein [Catenaria anguillulae PL171]|uniref:Kinase-like domain-containing protein n=1 Tax=Catenaria anguillulae PL171 TaxID=765915 RepID=A0A1Y2HB91_9FUNG|nr:kinase-like domain-containing protein [Catenaria anguillulae PL171]
MKSETAAMTSSTRPHDLTNDQGVVAYLAAAHPHLVPCNLGPLSGGYVNYVWSIHPTSTNKTQRPVILKYYPPRAHGFPADMPQSRAQAEYNALVHAFALSKSTSWTVPEPIHFDPLNHVVIMAKLEDSVSLLDYLREPRPAADLDRIGTAMAEFHRSFTSTFTKASVQSWFVNQEMAHFHLPFRNFSRTAEMHSLPNSQSWLDRALGPNGFPHPNQTLIHGDFWPNAIFVHLPASSADSAPETPVISIIDWEDHRFGHPGEDVAQMVGNMFIMLHGEPYHVPSVKRVIDAFVLGARGASLDLGDGFDAEAVCVKCVTSLVEYPHWGVEDPKAVVRRAAEGGVREVLWFK